MMHETEKFIEAVKRYPCIWNVFIPTYKCRETKDAAWREIIQETGIPDVDLAKDKWKKLKDAFREALNKRKKELRLRPHKKLPRPYKFQHVMEFLLPVLEHRGLQMTIDDHLLSNTDDETHNDPHMCMSSNSEQETLSFIPVESEIHEQQLKYSGISSNAQRRPYKRHCNDVLDFLMEDSQRREENASDRQQAVLQAINDLDSMDRFFLSMAEHTKKLPEILQLQIKRKVFHAVIEAEEYNYKTNGASNNVSLNEHLDVKPEINDLECTDAILEVADRS